MGKLVDKGTYMYPKWTLSLKILGVKLVCAVADLERGVQPLAHEAHPKMLGVPRPLPVT